MGPDATTAPAPKRRPGNPNWGKNKGSGIPAKGAGWGGPARTEDNFRPFKPGETAPAEHKRVGKMEAKEYREKLRAKLERSAAAYDAALDSGNPFLALSAAKQIEDRVFGQAKQVIETQADTRTEAELLAEIRERQKRLGIEEPAALLGYDGPADVVPSALGDAGFGKREP